MELSNLLHDYLWLLVVPMRASCTGAQLLLLVDDECALEGRLVVVVLIVVQGRRRQLIDVGRLWQRRDILMLLFGRSNTLGVLRLLASFLGRGGLVVWHGNRHVMRVIQKRILRSEHGPSHKTSFRRSVHLRNVRLLVALRWLFLCRNFRLLP